MSVTNRLVPVRSVRIENFRAIRDLTIDLDPRVTLFFGVNAAGKTSILDAISIGLGAVTARVPQAKGRDFAKRGDLRVPWKDNREYREQQGVERPYSRVEIACANGLIWDVSKYRSAPDRRDARAGRGMRALHAALDPLVKESLSVADGRAVPVPLPLVAAYGTERAVVEVPLRERGFASDFPRFGALDRALRATTRFKTVFEWFRVMEDEERRERERRKDFNFVLPQLQWVRRAVESARLRCRRPRIETRPIRMVVDFEHRSGEWEPLDISGLSDGFRTHFSLVVDLTRRMVQLNPSDDLNDPQRGTNTEAVILIDEIDLHLDPTWQATVVEGLLRTFPNTQFILTTHSEQVIGSVATACVRKLVDGDGEVAVERVPFAQGATGERILIDLMGAQERVSGPVTDKLMRYVGMIDEGQGQTPEATSLRRNLDEVLPGDSRLHQADLEMQKRALLARIERTRG